MLVVVRAVRAAAAGVAALVAGARARRLAGSHAGSAAEEAMLLRLASGSGSGPGEGAAGARREPVSDEELIRLAS